MAHPSRRCFAAPQDEVKGLLSLMVRRLTFVSRLEPWATSTKGLKASLALGPVFVLLAALLTACGDGTVKIKGSATYLEKMALPADAVFEAELIDLNDGTMRVLASSGVQAVSGVPLDFAVTVRKNAIDKK